MNLLGYFQIYINSNIFIIRYWSKKIYIYVLPQIASDQTQISHRCFWRIFGILFNIRLIDLRNGFHFLIYLNFIKYIYLFREKYSLNSSQIFCAIRINYLVFISTKYYLIKGWTHVTWKNRNAFIYNRKYAILNIEPGHFHLIIKIVEYFAWLY